MTKLNKINIEKDKDKWENINKIIKDLPDVIIKESLKWLKIENKRVEKKRIKGEGGDIISLLITSYYEYKTKGEMTIINKYKDNKICLFEEINKIDINSIKEEEVKYLSKIWYKEKNERIEMNDVKEEGVKVIKGVKRLESLKISSRAEYEKRIEIKGMKELKNYKIMGYINCEDELNIYEIRCGEIKDEDKIELGIKMYINESEKEINKKELEEAVLEEELQLLKEEYKKEKEDNDREIENQRLKEEEINKNKDIIKYYKNNDIIEGDEIKYKYEGKEQEGKVKIVSNLFMMNDSYIYLHENDKKYKLSKIKDIEYKYLNNEKNRYKQYYKSNKCNKKFKEYFEEIIGIRNKIDIKEVKEVKGLNNMTEDILKIECKLKDLRNKKILTKNCKYYIYNITTNELLELKSNIKELREMVEYILYNKYNNNVKRSDNEFILEQKEILNKYFNIDEI